MRSKRRGTDDIRQAHPVCPLSLGVSFAASLTAATAGREQQEEGWSRGERERERETEGAVDPSSGGADDVTREARETE